MKNIIEKFIQLSLLIALILIHSCGKRYDKITPAWKIKKFKAQTLTIHFNQNSIEIPKQREGLSSINGVGSIFEKLFAEVAHIQLKETGEIEIPPITKDIPALERLDFDLVDELELESLELKIPNIDLSISNNFNFIKRIRLKLSFEKIVKIDEVEILQSCQVFLLNRKPIFSEIPALTFIDGKLASWSTVETNVEIIDFSMESKERKLAEFDFNGEKKQIKGLYCAHIEKQGGRVYKKKNLSRVEVLRYDEKFADSSNKNMAIKLLDDYSDQMIEREVFIDKDVHEFTIQNGVYLKQILKFKINNLDWKKILKNNNRFSIHLYISADHLPPLSFSKVDLSFNLRIKPKF